MNIIMESEVSLTAALRTDSFEAVLISEGIIILTIHVAHIFIDSPIKANEGLCN